MKTKSTEEQLRQQRQYKRAWKQSKGLNTALPRRFVSDNLAPALLSDIEVRWLEGIILRKRK